VDRIVLSYNQIVILTKLEEGAYLVEANHMLTLFDLDVTTDARILRKLSLVDYVKAGDAPGIYVINATGREALKSGTAITTVSYLMAQK